MLKSSTLIVMSWLLISAPKAFGCQSGLAPGASTSSAAESGVAPQQPPEAKKEAVPAYLLPQRVAQVAEKHTKGWLNVSGEVRLRFEGRTDEQFRPDHNDSFLLTRVRLGLDVHPTNWLRVFAEAQDSQAIGLRADPDPPLFEDTFDLRQGYMEFFDRERLGVGVRVGRQELTFGDERLVGAFNWSNTARTFDAVRLFYARPKYRLDVFASSVVVNEDGVFNRHRDGANFYGTYNSFQNLIPKGTVEGYLLWRTLPRVVGERGSIGNYDAYTFGTRWVGKLPAEFDYRLELAGQRGDYVNDDVRAWALHTQLGYTLTKTKTTPRLLIEYNFASGDDDPQDGRRETFDQLFPTNHDKYGIADQVGWRNMHNLRAGLGLKFTKRVSGQFDYHSFWLASRRDALYAAGGAPVARVPTGARSRHVGQEVDLDFRVTLAKYLFLWGGYAHLFAGNFLKEATPGANTGFYYAMLNYRF